MARRRLAASVMGALLVAAHVSTGLAGSAGLVMRPSSYDFGPVGLTTSGVYQFQVWNETTTFATFLGSNLTGSADFSVDREGCSVAATTPLEPGASCTIAIRFTPTAVGTVTGSATYRFDIGSVTATYTGTGIPQLEIKPDVLEFGAIPATTTATAPVSIINHGSTAASWTWWGPWPVWPSIFSGDLGTCGTIAAGGSCAFTVTFQPPGPGSFATSLTVGFATSAGSTTVVVPLSGTGSSQVGVAPASQDFGFVASNGFAPSRQLTVTNQGTTSVYLAHVQESDAEDFPVVANGCASELAGGRTCTFDVSFNPHRTGPLAGTQVWTFNSAASGGGSEMGTFTVSLSGAGTPQVTAGPSSMDFGSVQLTRSSAPATFTITNNGSVAASLRANPSLSAAPSFTMSTDTCAASLPAYSSCVVDLAFRPLALGALAGTVTLDYAENPVVLSLAGTGTTQFDATPAAVSFGQVFVGTASTAHVTVTNSGTETASLSGLAAPDPANFGLAHVTCGALLPAGGTCELDAVFRPASDGAKASFIQLDYSVAGFGPAPVIVQLQGTGVADTRPLEVMLVGPASPTNATTLAYTLTFSKPVTDLTTSDLTVTGTATGCAIGSPAGSGTAYTVAVTGCSDGTVTLSLGAGTVADLAGSRGPASVVAAAPVAIDRTGPSTPSLSAAPRVGASLAGTAVPLMLTWTAATDAGSGIAAYELEQSTDGITWTSAGTYAGRKVSVTARSGGSVRYRVRAVDGIGTRGAWGYTPALSPRLVQQSSRAVRYGGTWSSTSSTAYSGGSARYAKAAGRSASYTFTGRSIALVTTKASSRGRVRIYMDGVYQATVDLYRSSSQYRVLAWQRTWPTSGTRTVKVVVVGTSGRPRVDLDAFAVMR